jgi:MFS family permease
MTGTLPRLVKDRELQSRGEHAFMVTTTATGAPEADLKWNFSVNLVERVFITFGMSMISASTILPLLVSELTTSKVAVGLVSAIFMVGTMVPQLLTAGYTESLVYKRPFVSGIALIGGRLPYVALAAAVWLLGLSHPTLTLLLLFLLVAITALSNGVIIPAWLDMIAKVIPIRLRGLFFGVGNGLGALLGVAGGLVAGRILTDFSFPDNYALCFLLASGAMIISWAGVSATREPPSAGTKSRTPLSVYLRRLPQVLRDNPNYARYIISTGVASLGGMGTSFMIVYARERYGVTGTQVGTLTALLIGSQAVTNLIWGMIGDRKGHQIVLVAAAIITGGAVTATWVGDGIPWLWLAFTALGVGIAANSVSRMNIVLEFGTAEDRPTYIGLTNTSLAPISMVAPILGGWLIDTTGYVPMFVATTVLSVAGGVLLALWFRDPRRMELAVGATRP